MKSSWFALGLLLAAFTVQASDAAPVRVVDAWIRWLPGSLPAGGFLTVVNSGDRAVQLTGASSDEYARVTLHQSRQQGGVASMVPVDSITIAPHSQRVFENEGFHLMLEQATRPVKPGDHITLTIRFASGLSIPVPFEVRSPAS